MLRERTRNSYRESDPNELTAGPIPAGRSADPDREGGNRTSSLRTPRPDPRVRPHASLAHCACLRQRHFERGIGETAAVYMQFSSFESGPPLERPGEQRRLGSLASLYGVLESALSGPLAFALQ